MSFVGFVAGVVGGLSMIAAPFVALGWTARRWSSQVGRVSIELLVNPYGKSQLFVDEGLVASSASRGWLRAVVDGHRVDAYTGENQVALLVDGALVAGVPLPEGIQLPPELIVELPSNADLEALREAHAEVARMVRQPPLAS